MEIISKADAIAKGLKRYYTGIPCIYGHVCERFVRKGDCICCKRESNKKFSKTEKGRAIGKRSKEKFRKSDKYKEYNNNPEVILRKRNVSIEYREKNKEKLQINSKVYREKNKDKLKLIKKDYYEENKASIKAKHKEYAKTEKGKAAALKAQTNYRKTEKNRLTRQNIARKRRQNINDKLIDNYRHRIWSALQYSNNKKTSKSVTLLGCSVAKLKKHLEKSFDEKMSWENYGEWHVDHIVPCSFFVKNYDFSDDYIQRTCFNYRNLQPMWGKENASKLDQIEKRLAFKMIKDIQDIIKEEIN